MRDRLNHLLREKQSIIPIEDYRTRLSVIADLADYLIDNGVIVLPCKVGDMVDKFFSHNTVIALWYDDPTDKRCSHLLWHGMAWDIPEKHMSLPFVKFMGIVAESIDKSDTLNIKVELTREEALKGAEGK